MAFNRDAIKWSHLFIKQPNGSYVTRKISGLTDAQIKAALGDAKNANSLADGWVRNSSTGTVSRAPAAGIGPAPPASTPPPAPAPTAPSGGIGPAPGPGTPAPVHGGPKGSTIDRSIVKPYHSHLFIKQPNGSYVTQRVESLSDAQLKAALADPKNVNAIAPGWYIDNGRFHKAEGAVGGVHPNNLTTAKPGGAAPGGAAPGGAAPGGTAPGATTPGGATPAAPSWIPPMIGTGGLNADPTSGRIDWSGLLGRIQGVSAVDPQYAQALSANIAQAMQAVALPQAEIQSLTTVDPTTGKTLYQTMFDQALRSHNQAASSSLGNAAARGIGSSGMANTTLANNATQFQTGVNDAQGKYGNKRIADLLKQMTSTLAEQDQNFLGSYYDALSRANQRIPGIPDPTAGG